MRDLNNLNREHDDKLKLEAEAKQLEELENKILYAYFRDLNQDEPLSVIAKSYLKGKELKEYLKLNEKL